MSIRTAAFIAAVVIAFAVCYPLVTVLTVKRREHAASLRLQAIAAAQRVFRAGAGRGGYATTLESLIAPCPGGETTILPANLGDEGGVTAGYHTSLRAARDAAATGVDCHGRPTSDEFLASTRPLRPGVDGIRAMSVRSDGRIYLFFDAVPPNEQDMAPGGLAMPLDALTRIP